MQLNKKYITSIVKFVLEGALFLFLFGRYGEFKFGATSLRVPPNLLRVNIPCCVELRCPRFVPVCSFAAFGILICALF